MHPIRLPFYSHIRLFLLVHPFLDYRKILRAMHLNFLPKTSPVFSPRQVYYWWQVLSTELNRRNLQRSIWREDRRFNLSNKPAGSAEEGESLATANSQEKRKEQIEWKSSMENDDEPVSWDRFTPLGVFSGLGTAAGWAAPCLICDFNSMAFWSEWRSSSMNCRFNSIYLFVFSAIDMSIPKRFTGDLLITERTT